MEELYYMPSLKVNSKVADIVVEGNHIEIDGIYYKRLSRKPRGRSLKAKLQSIKNMTTIVLYN